MPFAFRSGWPVVLRRAGPSLALVGAVWLAACSSPERGARSDSAAAAARSDSVQQAAKRHAVELRDGATETLAQLLRNPTTAVFDSLRVVQPPEQDGRLPAMAVCGRIAGRPGIGGSARPTAFIYQARQTVFVDDAAGHASFLALWNRTCANPGSRVELE